MLDINLHYVRCKLFVDGFSQEITLEEAQAIALCVLGHLDAIYIQRGGNGLRFSSFPKDFLAGVDVEFLGSGVRITMIVVAEFDTDLPLLLCYLQEYVHSQEFLAWRTANELV